MSYGLPFLGNARSVRGDQFRRPNSSGRGGAVFGLSATRKLIRHRDLTPFDTNWKKGSGATPLTTQDL